MKISLSPDLERLIADRVRSGRYHSADDVIRESLALLQAQETAASPERATNAQPIAEILAAIANTVPDTDWAGVPADLSKNLDHYLYGSQQKP